MNYTPLYKSIRRARHEWGNFAPVVRVHISTNRFHKIKEGKYWTHEDIARTFDLHIIEREDTRFK